MNYNCFWQPAPISLIPTSPACFYFDQQALTQQNQSDIEYSFKELKSKFEALELENFHLKEEILLLETIKSRKAKRIVKRRKEEQLDKKFKCSHFNCKKQYASPLALNLHMRTKHPQDVLKRDLDKKSDVSDQRYFVKHEGEYSNTGY